MRGDYHMHTVFSDGKNTAEEMVLAAMEKGLKEIGISDHACTPKQIYCIKKNGEKAYVRELNRLKEKYADKITVLIGIEADYYSEFDPSLYDYIIGSVHYLDFPARAYSVDSSAGRARQCIREMFGGDKDAYAAEYFSRVAELPERLGANVIGHFDLLTKFQDRGIVFPYEGVYARAAEAAIKKLAKKAVFEINTGAISRGYRTSPYPCKEILDKIRAEGGKVLLSSDSHSAENIAGSFDLAEAAMKNAGFTRAGFTDRHGKEHIQI